MPNARSFRLFPVLSLAFFASSFLSSARVVAQSYIKLHQRAIVADTHNDFLSSAVQQGFDFSSDLRGKTHSDLARFQQGGVDVQVFSIFCDDMYGVGRAYARANQEIDSLYAITARNHGKMQIVKDPAGLEDAVRHHRLAAMMGVEGGHMIEDRVDYLDSLAARGVRYMTLTWNNSTSWATSARDETQHAWTVTPYGLNEKGKEIVRRMNALGMMVDLSHVGEKTFWDAIHTTSKPVLVSHSSCYALCPVPRNLKDDQIKAVGENGGVIQVNFYSGFLDSTYMRRLTAFAAQHKSEIDSLNALHTPDYAINEFLTKRYPSETKSLRPPLSLLIDHIEHIIQIAGVDHVGLGSDFDGIESAPQELDDVTCYPVITRELLKRGHSASDVEKILGGNFVRVFKANMK
jgi:membrane dipeptidase